MRHRQLRSIAFLFCVMLVLTACAPIPREMSCQLYAMNTEMSLKVYGMKEQTDCLKLAEKELYRLDALLSATDPNSEIGRLNACGKLELSEETSLLLQKALEVGALTDGAYDCTLYPLSRAWGFVGKDYRIPESEELEQLLAHCGLDKLKLDGQHAKLEADCQVDLGGIAKGYAAARLRTLLKEAGITSGILSLGGNVAAIGEKPDGSSWTVAICDPREPGTVFGSIQVRDRAVVTSGGYQRYFVQDGQTYWHILDPKTGRPSQSGLLSVTIVCKDDTLADGLSTALFVLGHDRAEVLWRENKQIFDAVWMDEQGKVFITEGLEGCFSCQEDYEVLRG